MTNAEEIVNGSIDNSDTNNNAFSKKLKLTSHDQESVVAQVENIELKTTDSDSSDLPKLLWDPKNTKINQDTKLKEFTALIENKYSLKFSELNHKTTHSNKFFQQKFEKFKLTMQIFINGPWTTTSIFGKNSGTSRN
jgi:hypothetical protein